MTTVAIHRARHAWLRRVMFWATEGVVLAGAFGVGWWLAAEVLP
jgi:hypothetical protein